MTNHDRNLPAAQRLPVNARSAGCQAKIVCDLLVETEGESYRLQDARAAGPMEVSYSEMSPMGGTEPVMAKAVALGG